MPNNSETVLVMAKNLDDLNEVISSLEHRSIMVNNHQRELSEIK